MNTREALLRAVVEHPREDTPRLVLADWLDEYGDELDGQHAAFIRAGIEYAIPARRTPCMLNSFTKFCGEWSDLMGRVWPGLFPRQWWWIGGFVAGGVFEGGPFMAHAGAVFAAQPIETVRLHAHEPLDGVSWLSPRESPRRSWARPAPRNSPEQIAAATLPERLFRLLPGVAPYQNWISYGYLGGITAYDALSIACVRFGRAEAELGELK